MDVREARSLVFDCGGKVRLQYRNIGMPQFGQLRIRIVACGVCHREWHVLKGTLARRLPTVMGHEPVGVVDAVGPGVDAFRVGDWVTGVGEASLADYDIVDAAFVAKLDKPAVEPELWLGEPAMCVVNAVNRASPRPDARIVVCGAGFMGSLLLQAIRRRCAAAQVLALDTRPDARQRTLSIGADAALSPVSSDMAKLWGWADVVFEVSGSPGTVPMTSKIARNGGTLCLFAHHLGVEPEAVNDWHLRGITVLNTVPWAAPDLKTEVLEGVTALNRREITLDHLVENVVIAEEAPNLMMRFARSSERPPKTVVTFA
jgi:threonine dehydrogenase-like Zn-dependent dehydrogenase